MGKPPDEHEAIVVLLELTRDLTDNRPLEEALHLVTDGALRILAADHASVRLLDATRMHLLSGARSGSGTEEKPLGFRRGEGIIGWVVENREPVRIDDALADDRYAVHSGQGFSVRSLMAEPLWSSGEVIGVLSVSSPEGGVFTEGDQILLRLLANCSVPPIERARLERLAMIDDMTMAFNHRYLVPRLGEEIERAKRAGTGVSMLLMDLDHFKAVNDAYGHAVGDVVLRLFADRVRTNVRRADVFVRRGGEEFVLIMPTSNAEQGIATASRIRENLEAEPLSVGGGQTVAQTVSIGVATWDGKETAEALEHRADLAMYEAKKRGRNRVEVA
jgi:diguanylate cyclase (GGDEF)-like protein